MKRASKLLSAFLALVMTLALTVPAFAAEKKLFTTEDVNFSVAPIGVATISGETEWGGNVSYENVYVFDQDCIASLKDGRGFTDCGFDEIMRGIGDMQMPEGDELFQTFQFDGNRSGIFYFGFSATVETEAGSMYIADAEACRMTSKTYLDQLVAAGFSVDLKSLGQAPAESTTPAQPEVPADAVTYTVQRATPWARSPWSIMARWPCTRPSTSATPTSW